MRFGVLFIVIGFGSAILHFTGYQFRVVGWAEDWQPGLGVGLGGLGVLICVLVSMARARKDQRQAAAPPAAGYPMSYPPQQQFAGRQMPYQSPQFTPQQQFHQPPVAAQYPPQPRPQGPLPQFPPRPDAPPAQLGQQG